MIGWLYRRGGHHLSADYPLLYFLDVRLGIATIDPAIIGAFHHFALMLVRHDPQRNPPQRASHGHSIPGSTMVNSSRPLSSNTSGCCEEYAIFRLFLATWAAFSSLPFLSRVRTDSGRVANHSPTTFNGLVPPSTVSNKVAQSRVGQRSLGAASFGTRNSRQNCLPCPVSSQGNHSHRRNC